MLQATLIRWAVAAALAFGAGWAVNGWRMSSAIEAERAAHAVAVAAAVQSARAEEQRRAQANKEIADHATAQLSKARAALARADAGSRELLDSVARLASTCGDPPAAARGSSPESAGAVLADLLGRMDEAARGMARYADEAAIAGRACEAAYVGLGR